METRKMTIREYLMRGFTPCTNHCCIIEKPVGVGTCGPCHCLTNMSRARLGILSSRLSVILEQEIEI